MPVDHAVAPGNSSITDSIKVRACRSGQWGRSRPDTTQ
ncbi:hypothetical protein GZL_07094 [Streptomyces sp. 769]|nr:hypothetical protein GZL_07094 [Streptomyces sp. 769]